MPLCNSKASGAPEETLYLSTATCMAAFAFEAYLEPTVGTARASADTGVSVVNGSASGTTVQYMDSTVIQELFSKAMLVTVSSVAPPPKTRNLLPGISSFVVEVTVGDSYARTSTRRPPMLSLSTASLEWNETVSMWPAGPTNAAASVHMLQYNRHSSPPVTETLLETPSTATGGNDAARQRTVGTSPMPGNQNRRRGSGPLNGNSAARSLSEAATSSGTRTDTNGSIPRSNSASGRTLRTSSSSPAGRRRGGVAATLAQAAISPLRQVSARLSPQNRSLNNIAAAAEEIVGLTGTEAGNALRCTFPEAPRLTVRVYEIGLAGREQLVSRGDATLPSDWAAAGQQGLTVELFEVAGGVHSQQRGAHATTRHCGEVRLSVHAVDEPGAQLTPSVHTQPSNAWPKVRAFRDALVSPKPKFVRIGNPVTTTAMGALKAALGANAPTRTQTLDPEAGIHKLAAELQKQEGSGLVTGATPALSRLEGVFSAPAGAGFDVGIGGTATAATNTNSSPESSPTTMNTACSHSALSMHSMMSSTCSSTHGIHASMESQGPGAVSAAEGEIPPLETGAAAAPCMGGVNQRPDSTLRTKSWRRDFSSFARRTHTKDWYLKELNQAADECAQDPEAPVDTADPEEDVPMHAEDASDELPGVPQPMEVILEGEDMSLGELSVPGKVAIKNSWKILTDLFPEEVLAGARPIGFVSSRTTHTQAWVHCNWQQSTVVVSFRGTEPSKAQDVMIDAALLPKPFPVHPADWQLLPSARLQHCVTCAQVHRGFIWAWESVTAQISDLVLACTSSAAPAGTQWKVVCTGHSLGGALATLTAFDFAVRRDFPYEMSCYTFGSPRLGNAAFMEAFSELMHSSWRVHTYYDLVPMVPPPWYIWGYTHAVFRKGGTVILPPSHPISFCKNPAFLAEGIAKIRDKRRRWSWWNWGHTMVTNMVSVMASLCFGHFPDAYLDIITDTLMHSDSSEQVQKAVRDVKQSLRVFRTYWGILDFL